MALKVAGDSRLVAAQREDVDRALELLRDKQVRSIAFDKHCHSASESAMASASILRSLLELPHVAESPEVLMLSEPLRLPHVRPVE
jgi:hypothetical protein